jgi:hypothetical protein
MDIVFVVNDPLVYLPKHGLEPPVSSEPIEERMMSPCETLSTKS